MIWLAAKESPVTDKTHESCDTSQSFRNHMHPWQTPKIHFRPSGSIYIGRNRIRPHKQNTIPRTKVGPIQHDQESTEARSARPHLFRRGRKAVFGGPAANRRRGVVAYIAHAKVGVVGSFAVRMLDAGMGIEDRREYCELNAERGREMGEQ